MIWAVVGCLVWAAGAVWLLVMFHHYGDMDSLSIPKLFAWPIVVAFEIARAGRDASGVLLTNSARAQRQCAPHKPRAF